MSYSTGELAELCGVTVRTVQFYDRQGLLKPENFSEGGRRLYGENSLKLLQIICMYKELGLSLSEIKDVLSDEDNCRKILLSILGEREKSLDEEIKQNLSRRESVKVIKQYLSEGRAMTRNTFFDVQTIMKGKKKQKATYATMLVTGITVDAVIITAAVLWGVYGMWLPFAIGVPCAVALITFVVFVAYRNLAYVCSVCGKKFRPKLREFLFAKHTVKTRKLTCPHCGVKTYHTETYAD